MVVIKDEAGMKSTDHVAHEVRRLRAQVDIGIPLGTAEDHEVAGADGGRGFGPQRQLPAQYPDHFAEIRSIGQGAVALARRQRPSP